MYNLHFSNREWQQKYFPCSKIPDTKALLKFSIYGIFNQINSWKRRFHILNAKSSSPTPY
jgi:hypothetical protein